MYISGVLSDYPEGDEIAAATYINKIIESEILRAPEQYLWMHRRFKTRPKDGGLYTNDRSHMLFLFLAMTFRWF